MVDFKKIKELNETISELIKQRPEFALFQEQLNEELKKAESPSLSRAENSRNRLSIIESKLLENKDKLLNTLQELKKSVQEMQIEAVNLLNKLPKE